MKTKIIFSVSLLVVMAISIASEARPCRHRMYRCRPVVVREYYVPPVVFNPPAVADYYYEAPSRHGVVAYKRCRPINTAPWYYVPPHHCETHGHCGHDEGYRR